MKKPIQIFSGKFVLRVPPEFHRRLSILASQEGESLNRFCIEKIKNSLYLEGEVPLTSLAGGNEIPTFQKKIFENLTHRGVPLIGVVMFGSSVRGEARASSDIDLLLVVEKKYPLVRNLYNIWDECLSTLQLDSGLAAKLSPQFVHLPSSLEEAGSLWFECAIEGLIASDTELSIGKFLAQIRVAIMRGELKRESSHGHHYWVKSFDKVS